MQKYFSRGSPQLLVNFYFSMWLNCRVTNGGAKSHLGKLHVKVVWFLSDVEMLTFWYLVFWVLDCVIYLFSNFFKP